MIKDTKSPSLFTVQSKAALLATHEEAQRLGSSLIEPEHLLLGLIADPQGNVASILRTCHVKLEDLRKAALATIPPAEQIAAAPDLSPRAKRAIRLSVFEAKGLGHGLLDAEHLLLGILCEEGEASKLLKDHGVSLKNVRAVAAHIYDERGAADPQQCEERAGALAQPGNAVRLDSELQQRAVALARSKQSATCIYLAALIVLIALIFVLAFQLPAFPDFITTSVITLNTAPVLSWQPVTGWFPLLVLLYVILSGVLLLAITLPFAWYTSYFLPRHHNVRRPRVRVWFSSFGRGLLQFGVQMWLLIEVATLFEALQPRTWWAWTALVQLLSSIILARFGSLLSLTQAKDIVPFPEGEVAARFRTLVERLHIPPCRLLLFKVSQRTSAANAFFCGWGRGRRVLLTDTLVRHFSLDEIEVVLAHELAHLVHHDIWKRLFARGLSFLGIFFLVYVYLDAIDGQPDLLQLIFLFAIWSLLLMFSGLSTRYQRYQEHQADEFALQVTGKVQAFKDAMTRLTNMNTQLATSTRRARHPARHLTLSSRLKHADEFAARYTPPEAPVPTFTS